MRPEIASFKSAATIYCRLLESPAEANAGQFLRRCSVALADVYAAAARLPSDISATDREGHHRETDGKVRQELALEDRLTQRFGDFPYWLVFDPFSRNDADSPVMTGLMRDLAEVYSDLREALERDEDDDSVWDSRFAFDHHWGRHASAALYALHNLVWTAGEAWVSPDD
jgi:hypothetical protein